MTNEPKLPACAHRVIAAQVHGVDRPTVNAAGETIPPGTPLDLRTAALATGMTTKGARKWSQTPQWIEALKAEQDARAFAEDPKNIEKLILTRDRDDYDGSLRLKAIESIRGKPPQHSVTKDEFKAIRTQAQAIGMSPGAIIGRPQLPAPAHNPGSFIPAAFAPIADAEAASWKAKQKAANIAARAAGYIGPPVAAGNEFRTTYDLILSNGEVRTLPRGFGLIPERKPEPPWRPRLGGRKV